MTAQSTQDTPDTATVLVVGDRPTNVACYRSTFRACNQLVARNVTGQPLMSLWFEEDLPLLNSSIERARVGGFFSAVRLNGFHSVIDQYPGIEIVGTLAADWNREKGRRGILEGQPARDIGCHLGGIRRGGIGCDAGPGAGGAAYLRHPAADHAQGQLRHYAIYRLACEL
jgi:hypothetical protein